MCMENLMNNQEKLILFLTIGDGYISNKTFEILHCGKQLEYLKWKRNLLIKAGMDCSDIKFKNNGGFPAYRFRTKSYDWIMHFKEKFYPRKNINIDLLKELNPLGLAIWYMDDGGLSQKKRNGNIIANDLMLNTGLSKDENQIIIDYFLEYWNIKFSQVKNNNCYRLRCGTKEARKFADIVKPYIKDIKCMHYKINIKDYEI